jgi:hypothetical protein
VLALILTGCSRKTFGVDIFTIEKCSSACQEDFLLHSVKLSAIVTNEVCALVAELKEKRERERKRKNNYRMLSFIQLSNRPHFLVNYAKD